MLIRLVYYRCSWNDCILFVTRVVVVYTAQALWKHFHRCSNNGFWLAFVVVLVHVVKVTAGSFYHSGLDVFFVLTKWSSEISLVGSIFHQNLTELYDCGIPSRMSSLRLWIKVCRSQWCLIKLCIFCLASRSIWNYDFEARKIYFKYCLAVKWGRQKLSSLVIHDC